MSNEWEKKWNDGVRPCAWDEVADFITAIVSTREKEIAEEVEKKVWLMRQWLNEDRITDGKKMVSNEDLLYWLNLNK